MAQGRDRRPELGYKLALECRYSAITQAGFQFESRHAF